MTSTARSKAEVRLAAIRMTEKPIADEEEETRQARAENMAKLKELRLARDADEATAALEAARVKAAAKKAPRKKAPAKTLAAKASRAGAGDAAVPVEAGEPLKLPQAHRTQY